MGKPKQPPLQVLMEEYARLNKYQLCYVIGYDCFYWLEENAGYFAPLNNFRLRDMILKFLESIGVENTISDGTFKNAIELLKHKTVLTLSDINSSEAIFNDHVILNLNTFATRPYQKGDVLFYHIDCNFPVDSVDCPIFKKFLTQVLVNDKNRPDKKLIAVIQEAFGYYLMSKMEPPIAFFLVGDGANGKSTLQFVLEQLVGGPQFVTANSIENLTTNRFDMQDLRFRRLNICSEEQSKYVKSDKFKSIVEGQLTRAEIKFGDVISFRPKTKHIFATNSMPSLDSVDGGVKRRIKIIPFKRTFAPDETDKMLKTEVFNHSSFAPELSAIIAWAIAGAKRLIENNYTFTASEAIDEEMAEYESGVSSTINFFVDNFIQAKKDELEADFYSITRLYSFYSLWCRESAGRKSISINNFKKEVRRYFKLKATPMGWDKFDNDHRRGLWLKFSTDSLIKSASKKSGIRNRPTYSDFMPDEDNTQIPFNN